MAVFLSEEKYLLVCSCGLKGLHLPTRGARTGQASKEETGEVPVTGREGEEGSQREGEQRNHEVTRETTCPQISLQKIIFVRLCFNTGKIFTKHGIITCLGAGLNSPPSPPTLLCNSPMDAIRLAVKSGDCGERN